MKNRLNLILIFLPFIFTACATVFNTTTQIVEIDSDPPHAKIYVDDKKFGTTPQELNLDRKTDHIVRLELEGYQIYETQITRKIDEQVYWNVLNGLLPGLAIDYFTGGMFELVPLKSEVKLQPAPKAPEKPAKK